MTTSPPILAAPRWRQMLSLPNVVTAAYVAVTTVLVMRHALWRDEAQAFLIARDSGTISELLYHLRLEGHPPLWHFLLWILTRFTSAPEGMQFLHLGFAAGSVYLVAGYSPFPTAAKILFPFGYFTLFEYGIISRNYQLILFFSLLLCVVWSRRRDAYVGFGVILALLSFSHALGVILATGFGAMVVADAAVSRDGRGGRKMASWRFAVGALVGAGGTVAGAVLAIPDARATYVTGWRWDLASGHVEQTATALSNAFFPMSQWGVDFWNRGIFQGEAAVWVGVIAGGMALLSVISSWRAVIVLLVAGAGLLAFFHGKFFGNWWHHGVLFITWISAYWIASNDSSRWGGGMVRWGEKGVLVTLLGVQVCGAVAPVYFGWKHPFSPGKEVAAYLRSQLRPDDVLVSDIAMYTGPVAAYLPGREFYFPSEERWGTFTLWTGRWRVGATAGKILDFAGRQKQRVFILHCSPHGSLPGAKTLMVFERGLVPFEAYSVFEIEPGIAGGATSASMPAGRTE